MRPMTIGAWSYKHEMELDAAFEEQDEYDTYSEFESAMYEKYCENFYDGMEYL